MERLDTSTESAAHQKGISWGKVLLGVAAVGAVALTVVTGFDAISTFAAAQPVTTAAIGTAGAGVAAVGYAELSHTGSEGKLLEAANKSKEAIQEAEHDEAQHDLRREEVETAAALAGSAGAGYWIGKIAAERSGQELTRGEASFSQKIQSDRSAAALAPPTTAL